MINFSELEKQILKSWQDNKIFQKTLKKESPKGDFIFYDGPPFATGTPHYGHLVGGTLKDVIPRFRTMQGYHVERKWGWDCHGLPIENIVEQKLGLKDRKDIEKMGVEKFCNDCHAEVLKYAEEWRKVVERMARWVDMDNDYQTMNPEYMESIWWVFKSLWDKGLIYEGYKSMHICPRCETTLSNFEVTQNYQDVHDLSATVKFELVDELGTFLLAWTTTPWTLIGNVALAVNIKEEYALFEVINSSNDNIFKKGDKVFFLDNYYNISRLFKNFEINNINSFRTQKDQELYNQSLKVKLHPNKDEKKKIKLNIFTGRTTDDSFEFSFVKEIKGKDLVGKSYKPIFDYYSKTNLENKDNGWQVYKADFVTTDEGTGIVHIAPAFGEEDMLLGQEKNLPFIQHVDISGKFTKEVTDWAGEPVKPKNNPQATDKKIVEWLEKNDKLFFKEEYLHSYPHCWRCDTPLLNYATSSWFVKVTDLKKDLIKNNQKINWMPAHMKDGRFGKWLGQAKDWAISRNRFWGTPLPVWKCEKCEEVKVLGSIEELKNETKDKVTKIILLRHGESEKNIKDIFDSSNENFSLTAKGKKQAQKAAGKLKNIKIDKIYSSPVLRAFQTAETVAKKKGMVVEKADELVEIKSGEWEQKNRFDKSIQEERSAYKFLTMEERFVTKRGKTGESWKDCEDRMFGFVKKIVQENPGKVILLVTHQAPIIYLFKFIKNLSIKESARYFNFDLLQKCAYPINVYIDNKTLKQIDIHKHRVDKLTLECPKCQGEMKRIEEVLDCWFESGSMPYAQSHYPFENKEKFEKNFPAQFIAEGQDQTRGWFYTLLVLSTALFNKPAYLNVIVNGLILAEDGKKMAKRLKNYPEPGEVMNKYGADVMRFYLINGPVVKAEELRFNEKEVRELFNKTVGLIWNVLSFYKLFENKEIDFNKKSSHILDKWIEAKLNLLVQKVTSGLESYDLMKATKPIVEFINELSTWYLRRSRDRFKSQDVEIKEEAQATLYRVLFIFSKILAPFMPFIAEKIYQDLGGQEESVHLEKWPKVKKLTTSENKLLETMIKVRKIVEEGLAKRSEYGIKVRQPLNFYSTSQVKSLPDQLKQLICEELNVREIKFGEDKLDTELTNELREEGLYRELIRAINNLRKENKLTVNDQVNLEFQTNYKELKDTINKYKKELQENTRSLSIKELSNESVERQQIKEIKVNELSIKIFLIKD